MIFPNRHKSFSKLGKRLLILGLIVMGTWCLGDIATSLGETTESPHNTIPNLLRLLEATESRQAALRFQGLYQYLEPGTMATNLQPLWPITNFLWAEIYRLRGDQAQARIIYQSLVEWSLNDDTKEEWGGSGLVIVSLWRWLQLVDTNSNVTPQEKEVLLAKAKIIWKKQPRLMQGMFQTLPWLNALPQLKENLLRRLSSLARSLGKEEEAQRFFVEYLSVASTGEMTPAEKELLAQATSTGVLSRPKVALLIAKRLEKLGDYDGTLFWLNEARQTGKTQIKAEASLYLARLQRLKGEKCLSPLVKELLDTAINESTDPTVVQESLFLQGRMAKREGPEGCLKDISLFQTNMQQIFNEFPQGDRADDALYMLASHHLELYCDLKNTQDLEKGRELFAKLRKDYPDRDQYIDCSWFKPAMALYARGEPEDLRQAMTYLQELEEARPTGPLHLAALFWLGRMAAESGQDERARAYFFTIIKECPYDYYAIRARLHLNLGKQASKQLELDAKTKEELKVKFHQSKNLRYDLSEKSVYHRRLEATINSGFYHRVLRGSIDCRNQYFPKQRLESISLEKLDEYQRLPHVIITLALRQDALVAVDTPAVIKNRLEVAKALSDLQSPDWPGGDWPLAVYISGASDLPFYLSDATGLPFEVNSKVQNDPGYLAIAYPKPFGPLIKNYSKEFNLSEAFLYAVIRLGSAFSTTFLEPTSGALGLIPFIPPTFKDLDGRWHLLKEKGKSSMEEFLLDANDNIYLGARWFQQEKLFKENQNILFALMAHHAGEPAVRKWQGTWQHQGRIEDYEFMIDTVRFIGTQSFVRSALNSYWIVQAADIY